MRLTKVLNETFSRGQRDVLRELFRFLNEEDVLYAVAGGVAVAYWVKGRIATRDEIDVVMDEMDFEEIYDVLVEEGWRIRKGEAGLMEGILNGYFSLFKSGVVVDVLLVDDWSSLGNCREWTNWGGIRVAVLKPEWLVVLKYIAGREKDIQDLIRLLSGMDERQLQRLEKIVKRILGVDAWRELMLLRDEGEWGLELEKRWYVE